MSEDAPLNAAQIAAQKRRERILGNAKNRLDLVTGQSEELLPPPERPTGSPKFLQTSAGTSRAKLAGLSSSLPFLPYKWPARLALVVCIFTSCIIFLSFHWMMIKFIFAYLITESLLLLLQWMQLRNFSGSKSFLAGLFVREAHASVVDDFLDFAILFLGLQAGRARLFRSLVLCGLQSGIDFLVCLVLFLAFGRF